MIDTDRADVANGREHLLEIVAWFIILPLDSLAFVVISIMLPAGPAFEYITIESEALIMQEMS